MPNNLPFKTNDPQSVVPTDKVAQSFIVQNPVRIKSAQVTLNFAEEGPAIRGKLSIQSANEQGLPSGQELAVKITGPIPRWAGSFTTHSIILDNPLELSPGTYFLVLESDGGASPQQYLTTLLNTRESYPEGGVYTLARGEGAAWYQHDNWNGPEHFFGDIFFVLKGITLQ
jgi:hypothetical protein